jgi:uncharacterized protein (DUF697 family)
MGPTERGRRNRAPAGEPLLSAVERVVDDCDTLIARVETLRASVTAGEADDPTPIAARIIDDYATRSAIAGGASSLPALLPGVGSVVMLVGGAVADMTLSLKHDVEMILCLTHLYGYDIRDDKERWLAYVMAGVRTHTTQGHRSYLTDIVEVQLDALPKYTPRQLFKLAATVVGRRALLSMSRSYLKAVPLVGIAVSASTNKFLTTNVGWTCVDALERRKSSVSSSETVDAVFT